MEESNSTFRTEAEAAIEAEEAILAEMEEPNPPGPKPLEGNIDDILARSGIQISDTDMDVNQIKRKQQKLVSDIGRLNTEIAKVAKNLSEVNLVIETYKGQETLRIAHEEAAKPGHTSQKTGRALSSTEKEYRVEAAIHKIVENTSPGYKIYTDKRKLEAYLSRIERALKNIDRQAMLLSSMAKIGTEQERFGNIR